MSRSPLLVTSIRGFDVNIRDRDEMALYCYENKKLTSITGRQTLSCSVSTRPAACLLINKPSDFQDFSAPY
jgi:hypothetical protein